MIATVGRGINQREAHVHHGRRFPRFAAFNAFLIKIYRDRKDGETIADLYPRIIAWFERENEAARE